MRMFFAGIVILAIFASASAKFGQGGLNFTIAVPRGEFRASVDRNGYGIGGHIAFAPNPYLAIGGALGMVSYGSESRRESFSTTIPDVEVEVTRSNNIAMLHLMLQLRADIMYVKPYVEGRFGFNYLWTETSIRDISGNEDIASSTNFADYALSYGGGGGLMIQVWKRGRAKTKDNKIDKVFIDVKTIYTLGGEAEYLKEGSVQIEEDATVIYTVSKSRTDLLAIHIGVIFEF